MRARLDAPPQRFCSGGVGGADRSQSSELKGGLPPFDLGLDRGALARVARGQRAHAGQQPTGGVLVVCRHQSTELMSDPDQLTDLVVVHRGPPGGSFQDAAKEVSVKFPAAKLPTRLARRGAHLCVRWRHGGTIRSPLRREGREGLATWRRVVLPMSGGGGGYVPFANANSSGGSGTPPDDVRAPREVRLEDCPCASPSCSPTRVPVQQTTSAADLRADGRERRPAHGAVRVRACCPSAAGTAASPA